LGSVYGPNDNNCLPFFTFVNNTLAGWSNIPVILGGDWNATPSSLPVNENPDVAFMRNIPSLVRTEQIRLLCELADLSDPFRTLHPDLRDFSYHPSGDTRKNRSRIDFFLISISLYGYIESCTIAQGFCRRSFDHKPIFLCLKKRRVKGRAFIHDCTLNHPADIVKLAVHKTTIFACMVDAGPLTRTILDSELEKLEQIEVLINRVIVLRGMATTGDLNPDLEGELLAATTELPTLWNNSATLDYLRGFDRQVQNDVFFEEQVACTKEAMLSLQSKIKEAESRNKRNWTIELSRLKTGNFAANFERICHLETLLNNASEKFVSDRIGNFIKTDVLNSEKMTPRFLKLAESNISSEISEIKDDNGIPFDCDKKRQDYITNFYEKLYKIPAGSRTDFANCVNDFLGNLTNHPVVRGRMLTDQERTRLETPLSLDELDESVRRCNLRSAPGIDGISNNFIKKFWPYFRSPLHDYIALHQ
jgi:hypothetical protein